MTARHLLLAGGGITLPSLGDLATINGPSVVADGNQAVALPTLGDLATINGPAIDTTVTVALPTLGNVATVNGPNVFTYEAIPLPSMGGGPVVGGLWIDNAEVPEPPPTPGEPIARSSSPPAGRLTVRVCDGDDPATVLQTLDRARQRRWQDVHNEAGKGSAVLQNNDPDLAAVDYGRLLRFELDGRARFLAVIEEVDQVVVSQNEDRDEATKVGGRGTMAQFENGVVYPEQLASPIPGKPTDQRVLNWTSAAFDDSGWSGVNVTAPISSFPGVAVGFPDGTARAIWPAPWGPGAGGIPIGFAYHRKSFTVATTGWYRVAFTADDGILVVLDGVVLFEEARLWLHLESNYVDVFLEAGTHQMSVRGENMDNLTGSAGNSAWILLSVLPLDNDGNISGAAIMHTDSTWTGVAYPPAPPGFTIGRAVRVLLEEAQARGTLLGWSLGFTDLADSHGQAWADQPELVFQCGLDLYSVLLQLAESWVELDTAQAQLVLYAYADGYGGVTGVAFVEASNILALQHEGRG